MAYSRNRAVVRRPGAAAVRCLVSPAAAAAAAAIVAAVLIGPSLALAQGSIDAPRIQLDEALGPAVIQDRPAADGVADDSRGVRTGKLETIDSAAVGTLDPLEGGFSPEMWKGSSRALIERLLRRLPVATDSFAMQDLARRLLLTRAAVPIGPATVPGMLALRVERLLAAGRSADVLSLIGRTSGTSDVPAISQARADALFLTGDTDAACGYSDVMITDSDDAYWLKAATLCRAKRGDKAGAGLAMELLHEQDSTDTVFFELAAELLGPESDDKATVDKLDPLRLEMLRAAGRTPTPRLLDQAEPSILASVSRDQGLALDQRLALAQRAEARGALSGAELARIFASVAFPPDEVPNAVDAAKSDPGPRANARLYQLAVGKYPREKRFTALQTLWRQSARAGNLGTVARATLAAAQSIAPAGELSWLAPDIARALLAAGDPRAAGRWLALLSGDARARLWPFLVFTGQGGSGRADGEGLDQALEAWHGTLSDLTSEQKRERSVLVFTLIEAVGGTVPEGRWRDLVGGAGGTPWQGDIAALRLLEFASDQGRLGEAVIYALFALAPQGPKHAHPDLIARVFRALDRVGLPDDARRIAVEALIGRGL